MKKSISSVLKLSAAAAALVFTLAASACSSATAERRPERPAPPIMRTERAVEGMLPPTGFPPRGHEGIGSAEDKGRPPREGGKGENRGRRPKENGEDEGKSCPPNVTPPEKKMIFILLPPVQAKGGEEETSEESFPSEQTITYSR